MGGTICSDLMDRAENFLSQQSRVKFISNSNRYKEYCVLNCSFWRSVKRCGWTPVWRSSGSFSITESIIVSTSAGGIELWSPFSQALDIWQDNFILWSFLFANPIAILCNHRRMTVNKLALFTTARPWWSFRRISISDFYLPWMFIGIADWAIRFISDSDSLYCR